MSYSKRLPQPLSLLTVFLTATIFLSACVSSPEAEVAQHEAPSWIEGAVFYQIFPERFRNGDPSNDPVRSSLDYLEYVPASWEPSSWTKDWYAMDDWEREKSDDVYASMFDRRFGGDIQGVIDQLPYLEALGINAIWFNPVFAARSLHKYDGNSFHHIDPHFGPDPEGDKALIARESHDPSTWTWTAADRLFLDMLAQAHERGIRIVLDGVWNHTGRGFFAFEDLREHQADSEYRDWYHVTSFDDPDTDEDEFEYHGWWGYEALPELADDAAGDDLQADVKVYVFASTARWMDPDGDGDPSDGIDGWRLDVAQDVPDGFWRDWNEHVRRINPDAYTVAEIWESASAFISRTGFSGAMNYHAFAMPVKGFLIDGSLDASGFRNVMDERLNTWSPGTIESQLNLIDSHDTPRLASMVRNRTTDYQGGGNEYDYDGGRVGPRSDSGYDIGPPDETDAAIMKLVALFQMSYTGSPIVYYGTEAGMWGADDPDDRKPMVWPDIAYEPQRLGPFGPVPETAVTFNESLHAFYRDVIALHHEHPALTRGSMSWIDHAWDPMVLAFTKHQGDSALTIVLNRSEQEVAIPGGDLSMDQVLFMTNRAAVRHDEDAGGDWLLPPLSGFVIQSP